MFSKNLISLFQKQETPFYFYDLALLEKTLDECQSHALHFGFHIHYAMKANFNEDVLKLVKKKGLGIDCVSGGEVQKAISLGIEAPKIVFAGVGKSDKEILLALKNDIFCFNVESLQELEVINQLASSVDKIAKIAIRINPNVDAKTHKYITTGLEENKFGINAYELPQLKELIKKCTHIQFLGIHFHIGSQITDLTVFENLCKKVNDTQQWFQEQGLSIKVINVGGGLGVDYQNPSQSPIVDFKSYFELFSTHLVVHPNQEIHFELGRSLVAQCGTLISRVLYLKQGMKKNILILDAGMTELMRPALYHAYHSIENLSSVSSQIVNYDVVGPICESSDTFANDRELPQTQRGDLIAIRTAGAYGEVMASKYNLREDIRTLCI